MPELNEAVIISAARTPVGKFLGSLKGFTAPELGALVVAEAVRRAGVDPASVDECIMGNVVSAGLGQNPARQAALHGGLSDRVAALSINKVCGSGLKAVMLAAQAIAAGDSRIVVAGGMESMSRAPYLLPGAREDAEGRTPVPEVVPPLPAQVFSSALLRADEAGAERVRRRAVLRRAEPRRRGDRRHGDRGVLRPLHARVEARGGAG